jgi:hypothetical protein
MSRCSTGIACASILAMGTLTGGSARAQSAPAAPDRSDGWNQATHVLAISSLALEALLPRVFTSDPDVTAGWKARWHVSVLAPTMTLTALALLNEQSFKSAFADPRPGCSGAAADQPGCATYGFVSTPSFVTGSALGQGAGVFLVDSLRWSHGAVHPGALVGEVGVPLVTTLIVSAGRAAGNWESAGQSWSSAGIGLVFGLGLGALYATMQRPECGYTGNLVCW